MQTNAWILGWVLYMLCTSNLLRGIYVQLSLHESALWKDHRAATQFLLRKFGNRSNWPTIWMFPKWKTLLNGWFGGTPIFGNTHLCAARLEKLETNCSKAHGILRKATPTNVNNLSEWLPWLFNHRKSLEHSFYLLLQSTCIYRVDVFWLLDSPWSMLATWSTHVCLAQNSSACQLTWLLGGEVQKNWKNMRKRPFECRYTLGPAKNIDAEGSFVGSLPWT